LKRALCKQPSADAVQPKHFTDKTASADDKVCKIKIHQQNYAISALTVVL